MSVEGTVTTRGDWEVPREERGNVTRGTPRKRKARPEARPQPTETTSQWSQAIEIGTPSTSPAFEATARAVLELSAMKPGWDGYRSPAIQKAAIDGVLNLLPTLEALGLPRPHVGPVPGGGLQIEWDRASKQLELEFGPDGTLEYLAAGPGREEEGTLTMEQGETLLSLLDWISE